MAFGDNNYKKVRTPRQAQADYAKRRVNSSALAPGLKLPTAPTLSNYSKLSKPMNFGDGLDGPLTLQPPKPKRVRKPSFL
jgi:hypothetical protein